MHYFTCNYCHEDDKSTIMKIVNGWNKLNKIIKTMLNVSIKWENRFDGFFNQDLQYPMLGSDPQFHDITHEDSQIVHKRGLKWVHLEGRFRIQTGNII